MIESLPPTAGTPEQRLLFLQSIVQAADEAPTVQDALRAALSRVCEGAGWQAGRLQFSREVVDLAGRTFWHLRDPEQLASFRTLAEARRDGAGPLPEALRNGRPVWTLLPDNVQPGPGSTGTRATYAFPLVWGGRLVAVMEFFSASSAAPPAALLETLAFVSGQLGAILQRKPAEDALRRSEREYRALFESAHDAVLIVDPETCVVLDANQRCSEVYGHTRAGLIGLHLSQVWPGADSDRLRQGAEPGARNFEALHRRSDGSEMVVEISAGEVEFRGRRAMWMSNRDITERNKTLEALRTSEERYRLLFDASPQPMWVYDLESLRFLAVNQAAIDHYGYSREQFLARTIEEADFAAFCNA